MLISITLGWGGRGFERGTRVCKRGLRGRGGADFWWGKVGWGVGWAPPFWGGLGGAPEPAHGHPTARRRAAQQLPLHLDHDTRTALNRRALPRPPVLVVLDVEADVCEDVVLVLRLPAGRDDLLHLAHKAPHRQVVVVHLEVPVVLHGLGVSNGVVMGWSQGGRRGERGRVRMGRVASGHRCIHTCIQDRARAAPCPCAAPGGTPLRPPR